MAQVEQLDERVRRTVAPNGLRVLTEVLPGVRSAAVGIWVRAGGAHDPADHPGAAHLLEHLVFKGTARRSAHAIAHDLESRGGALDAYTSRDHTNFQAHLLDTDLPLAVDVLTDLVGRPLLRPEDLELERNVVLEEIRGVHDTPDDVVFELHARALWGDHPYGRSILGSAEAVSAISAPDLTGVHQRAYHPANCVVAAAGQVDHQALLVLLEREGWLNGRGAAVTGPVEPAAAVRGQRVHVARQTQQSHVVFGTDTVAATDPRRYPLALVINTLGGGMSSRLFQRVREELGLAYAVFAFQHLHLAGGSMGIYVGTRPDQAELATEAILAELARLAREGLTQSEVDTARRQMKGQIVLGLESPVSRMHRLANLELMHDRYRSIDDVLGEIDAVTAEQILAVSSEFLAPERQTILRLGPEG